MKILHNQFINSAVLVVALGSIATLHALEITGTYTLQAGDTPLITDNFTATGTTNTYDLNYNIASRQTGTAITQSWTGSGNAQTGNTTNVGQPSGTNGDYLLLAFGGGAKLGGLGLSTSNVAGPVKINFDMFKGSTGNPSSWTSFTLTATGDGYPVAGSGELGFLYRNNTGIQVFNNGGAIQDFASTSGNDSFAFYLADNAGTGSPFAGNGTRVIITQGGSVLGSYALNTGMGTSYLAFGSDGGMIGGVDNLAVNNFKTNVLDPSTAVSLTTSSAKLELDGVIQTVASLSGVSGSQVNLGPLSQLTVNGTDSTSFDGVISGTLAGLGKAGSGTLTLSGANTYTGNTTVTSGVLQIGNGGTTGSLGSGGVINNASLVFNRSNDLMVGNTISGTGALTKNGGGTLTLTGANGYTGGTTLSGGTLRLENTSALGNSRLGMANNTTLQLRSDNDVTFVGGNGLDGLGNGSITIDVNQLTSGASNKTLSFATGGFNTYNTTLNATGGNGYTLALGGINEGFNGPLTLNADIANLTIGNIGSASATSSLNVGGSSTTTISGAINTAGNFTKNGSGTLNLTGTSSFASVMIFEGGIVNASTFANNGTNSSLGAGTGDLNADTIGLVFRGGTLQYTGSSAQSTNRQIRLSTTGGGGTIDASGSNPSATLSFTATASLNLFENWGSRTLTLTGDNTGDNTFAMAITEAGTTSLVKSGAGKWVITGASIYSGATSVNAGTLVINGNNSAATGAVSVASGATLGGTGTVGGATTISGTHTPGNSPGVQSFSDNLSYASTSIFEWDLANSATGTRGTDYDGVNVGGTLSGTSGATFKVVLGAGAFTDAFWDTNRSWSDIFKAVVDGSGSALNIASVFSNITWYQGVTNMTGLTGTEGSFTITDTTLKWTAVPEPSGAFVGLLLGVGLLRRRR